MNLAHNLESPPTVPSGRHALALAAASATATAIEGMRIMGSVMTPQLASKIAVASGQQASGLGQSATYATLGTAMVVVMVVAAEAAAAIRVPARVTRMRTIRLTQRLSETVALRAPSRVP